MTSEYAILAKLGGFIGSNPQIISSYPPFSTIGNEVDILNTCFPIGAKEGKFIEDRYKKYLVLSYIFKIQQESERDDLFSLSLLLHKRDKVELYKPILTELVKILEENNLLNEQILTMYHHKIYEGINTESKIHIGNLFIDFSRMFKDIRAKILKEKPKLRGSFI